MTNVQRAFNATIDDVNGKDRTIVAKIGTGDLDRYATVIDPKGIDIRAYSKNPIVLFSHGTDPLRGSLPVGRNLWIRIDRSGNGRIIAKTQFRDDEFSRNLYECYEQGWMRGWSVSILPTDFGKPSEEQVRSRPELKQCELYYKQSELVEYSACSVPGNSEALTEDEVRNLSKVISRGIPVPDEVKGIVARLSSTGGLAGGGALIKPGSGEDAAKSETADDLAKDAHDDVPENGVKKKKKKRAADGTEVDCDDDDAEGDEAQRTIAGLPELKGRTFSQVFYTLRQDELEYRDHITQLLRDRIDWLKGKA